MLHPAARGRCDDDPLFLQVKEAASVGARRLCVGEGEYAQARPVSGWSRGQRRHAGRHPIRSSAGRSGRERATACTGTSTPASHATWKSPAADRMMLPGVLARYGRGLRRGHWHAPMPAPATGRQIAGVPRRDGHLRAARSRDFAVSYADQNDKDHAEPRCHLDRARAGHHGTVTGQLHPPPVVAWGAANASSCPSATARGPLAGTPDVPGITRFGGYAGLFRGRYWVPDRLDEQGCPEGPTSRQASTCDT